jgi:hypothetical protein
MAVDTADVALANGNRLIRAGPPMAAQKMPDNRANAQGDCEPD